MIAVDDVVTVNEDEEVVIDVQFNDINLGGGLTTTFLYTTPPNGSLELLDNDSIRYTRILTIMGGYFQLPGL